SLWGILFSSYLLGMLIYLVCSCEENIMFRCGTMCCGVILGGPLLPNPPREPLLLATPKVSAPASSFSPGLVVGSSSKKPRTGATSSRTSSMPPPAPSSREDMDIPSRPSCAPSVCLYNRHLLDQDKGKASLVADLRRGVLSPWDRHLLSRLAREELGGMGSLYLFKGTPPSSDAQRRKLEDRLERLGNENAKLSDAKKDMVGRCQQLEREVRQLKMEAVSQESALKKVVMDFPHSEEGKNFLEAYWESRLKEFKGSVEYQQEVAKIAGPFFEYGFLACKEQFQDQGYPPTGEEPSFLDLATVLDNALDPFTRLSV
ncbi:UNVERIFIED_CONTAM: hypothetical protein Sindi_0014600, partial [Sesamum indicum]